MCVWRMCMCACGITTESAHYIYLVTVKSWLHKFYKVAEGLKYLHHHNIIHHDLDNMLFYIESGIIVLLMPKCL